MWTKISIPLTLKNLTLMLSLSFLFITSCATFNGTMTSSACLDKSNFRYVKVVSGSAIGRLSAQGLVSEAKANMYENFPLKDNQAYANICVDFKRVNYLSIYSTQKVTVTADIVEFIK